MDVNLNINGDNDFISFSKLKKVKSELSNKHIIRTVNH